MEKDGKRKTDLIYLLLSNPVGKFKGTMFLAETSYLVDLLYDSSSIFSRYYVQSF